MIFLPTATNSMLSISNSFTLNSKPKSTSNHQLPTCSIDSLTIKHKKRRCECFDLHRKLIPYPEAWNWQKGVVKTKKVLKDKNEDFVDSVFVLQHPHVYTLGTGSSKDNFNFDMHHSPFDIFQTERGGEVTYHGPGQLVMYPVINLRYHKMDLHWYLRSLEEVIIRVLYSSFSIKASRIDGFTGVWVGDQKLAAIGVRVSQWITYHGLALNVTTDLTPFEQIVPCGIRDRRVGNIKGLLGSRAADYGDDCQLIDIAYNSMIKEFSEVFQFELQEETISALQELLIAISLK